MKVWQSRHKDYWGHISGATTDNDQALTRRSIKQEHRGLYVEIMTVLPLEKPNTMNYTDSRRVSHLKCIIATDFVQIMVLQSRLSWSDAYGREWVARDADPHSGFIHAPNHTHVHPIVNYGAKMSMRFTSIASQ